MVKILSKNTFDSYVSSLGVSDVNITKITDMCFISITDTDGHLEPYFKSDHENVLNLQFDDCSEDVQIPIIGTDEIRPVVAMKTGQAQSVIDFVDRHKNRIFIIHCTAGVSRSGAVGTFVSNYLGKDPVEFRKRNPYILPNPHVLSLLNRQIWERTLGPEQNEQ